MRKNLEKSSFALVNDTDEPRPDVGTDRGTFGLNRNFPDFRVLFLNHIGDKPGVLRTIRVEDEEFLAFGIADIFFDGLDHLEKRLFLAARLGGTD